MIGKHMIDGRRSMETSGPRTGRRQHVDALAMDTSRIGDEMRRRMSNAYR
jgi:hypothetical protein